MNRAAVVIGVNKTGNLPVLKDAVAGAARVYAWLKQEGYDAELLVDDQAPVLAIAVFNVVKAFVDKGVYDLLLIYFSGHGYLKDYSEHWLLSNAPGNPNEAVSLAESVQLARDCGIPFVVFISDACRSTPQSLRAGRVRGSLIFPDDGVARQRRAKIDQLFACLPGDPAYEVPVDKSSKQYAALFTSCLRKAYEDTPPGQTKKIGSDEVLLNSDLETLLPELVDAAAQSSAINLFQKPDIIIESGDKVYIARVQRSRPVRDVVRSLRGIVVNNLFQSLAPRAFVRPEVSERVSPPKLRDQAKELIMGSLGGGHVMDSRLSDAIRIADQLPAVDQFETACGFVLHGAEVVDVSAVGCDATLLADGGGGSEALVPVSWQGGAGRGYDGSVLVWFKNGTGTVLAALAGYIGTVIVDNAGGGEAVTDGVAQISYTPSRNSWRWQEYQAKAAQIEMMRARAGGLARQGVFRIEKEQAEAFAAQIRHEKSFDPTLGIYASYAYNDAGLHDSIESVARFVKEDLGGLMLYDVALLLGQTGADRFGWLAPFCPMLSQGWPLLRVQRAVMPEAVREAGEYRRASLWTTFERRGMDILSAAAQKGGLS